MKDVTVTWDLPTELIDGEAIPPGLIKHVKVDLTADAGENWSEIDLILPGQEQKVFIPELATGDWSVALTVVLTDGRLSNATMVLFNVPSDAPPNEVGNVRVAIG